jgi:hypothetical protein
MEYERFSNVQCPDCRQQWIHPNPWRPAWMYAHPLRLRSKASSHTGYTEDWTLWKCSESQTNGLRWRLLLVIGISSQRIWSRETLSIERDWWIFENNWGWIKNELLNCNLINQSFSCCFFARLVAWLQPNTRAQNAGSTGMAAP